VLELIFQVLCVGNSLDGLIQQVELLFDYLLADFVELLVLLKLEDVVFLAVNSG